MARASFSSAFGTVVRRHRNRLGLSQEGLAEAAGIHRNYVGNLERGEYTATLEVAERLGRALGVALEDLIRESRTVLARGAAIPSSGRKPRRGRGS